MGDSIVILQAVKITEPLTSMRDVCFCNFRRDVSCPASDLPWQDQPVPHCSDPSPNLQQCPLPLQLPLHSCSNHSHLRTKNTSLSFFLTPSCLKHMRGQAGPVSRGPPAYTGGRGTTPGHWLSDTARFSISAHGSNFCRKGEKGASGPRHQPAAAACGCLCPPLPTQGNLLFSPQPL